MARKRFLSSILLIGMLFVMSTVAFATNDAPDMPAEPAAYSVTTNEYDIYTHSRRLSNKELSNQGMSETHINLIKSDAIENELLERASLPASELSDMGYSSSQITILKNYNGEPIENKPELRGVFADMTAKFYKEVASSVTLKVRVYWEWSNVPLLAGEPIIDLMAIRWQGTNTNGQSINLAFYSATSYANANYYSRSGEYKYSNRLTIVCDSPYDHAYAKVPVGSGDSDQYGAYYAKTGNFYVQVMRTGTDYIKEAAFVFAYGHTVVGVSPSLSLPVSFGIGFSVGTEKMVEMAIRMSNTGHITEY